MWPAGMSAVLQPAGALDDGGQKTGDCRFGSNVVVSITTHRGLVRALYGSAKWIGRRNARRVIVETLQQRLTRRDLPSVCRARE